MLRTLDYVSCRPYHWSDGVIEIINMCSVTFGCTYVITLYLIDYDNRRAVTISKQTAFNNQYHSDCRVIRGN